MAVTQISRIMHRRGLRIDLPNPLNDGEFGWSENTRELFIGNGPYFGGNTQILTEHSPASLPPYIYEGHSSFTANTGFDPTGGDPYTKNANFPTERSYQNKFDDFLSILDYGAVGDGVIVDPFTVTGTDNAPVFHRALEDIYSDNSGAFADGRKRVAIRIPAGIYVVSRSILLYPYAALIGEGIGKTIIILDYETPVLPPAPTPEIGNIAVMRTADAEGQIGTNIGSSSAFLPTNIFVSGMTIQNTAPQTAAVDEKDIVKIEGATNIRFERVRFEGTWQYGDAVTNGSQAVSIRRRSVNGAVPQGLSFISCEFANTAYGFNIIDDDVQNVYVADSDFDVHFRAVKLGFDAAVDSGALGSGGSPELFRATHSRFTNINDIGFDVRTTGRGNISTFNSYRQDMGSGNFGFDPDSVPIRFDISSIGNASIGDVFDITDPSVCAIGLLDGPRVKNESSSNVVMNAQDPFQVPNGFCGDITIDGNLFVTGGIINTSTPLTFGPGTSPSTYVMGVVPFSLGNSLVVEYALRVAISGVESFRTGTLTVIHDGAPVSSTDLNYQDTYIEHDGPPSLPVAVYAEANTGSGNTEILVDIDGAHDLVTTNFTYRVLEV